jgi:hypothetical protein
MAEETLAAFLAGEIDPAAFGHADHVRVAFALLERCDFPRAAAMFSSALKAITARARGIGAYHETITVAFLALIAERRAAGGHLGYESFASANPELMDKTILTRWYTPARLGSSLAREVFILPEPSR